MSTRAKVTVPCEGEVIDSVRLDDAWSLVQEFSGLVRDSGTEQERQAVERITHRLDSWGIPYELHMPELLISLPVEATLVVGQTQYTAKTPSMAGSTEGLSAPIVYEAAGAAESTDVVVPKVQPSEQELDVAGRIVVTEGLPFPGRINDLEARRASGVVAISPGERIHEGNCTPIWGSPDLRTYGRQPTIPVVSISRPDGDRLINQIADGGAHATIIAKHDERWRPIPVLVAEIRGSIEPDKFILAHGHLDSWHVGVGDNATGDATLLELSRVLSEHRDALARSVRIAWWSGHSHGRYAGSTWFADTFALDLEDNCICHVNCDSPGCRDADVFEGIDWMAEAEPFAKKAILDFTGQLSEGTAPLRAGDISFNNLGVSTFFMLSSTMPAELIREKGYYNVGGCGGNIEWHTEADSLEIADPDRLLRDIRLYVGAVLRAANLPVHPLDFRATLAQLEQVLTQYAEKLGAHVELGGTYERIEDLRHALDTLYRVADEIDTIQAAAPVNDALIRIGRELVRLLYSQDGPYRQDPALYVPLLPELAAATDAVGSVPDGVLRTELVRARNRIDRALFTATASARGAVP